jgi:hypothetical protein
MLFITLGDGPIDPSPGPVNQPTDWVNQPRWANLARPHGMEAVRAHAALTERIGSVSQPHAGRRPRSPTRPDRVDQLRAPRPSRHALIELQPCSPRVLCMTQPFFLVDQSFYYNELSHFIRVNSTILSHILDIFCSVIFSDYCSALPFHVIKFSAIPPCYSAKTFIVL